MSTHVLYLEKVIFTLVSVLYFLSAARKYKKVLAPCTIPNKSNYVLEQQPGAKAKEGRTEPADYFIACLYKPGRGT